MTVLNIHIPDLLVKLDARHTPLPAHVPLLLVDGGARVLAASALAQQSGAQPGMSLRRARSHCPDALTREANLPEAAAAQQAFLDELARFELPAEPQGYGRGYLSFAGVVRSVEDVIPIAQDLGRTLRRVMGDDLAPALGADTVKFTATCAASIAKPGSLRAVPLHHEAGFLHPLPIALLPLPAADVQLLGWLGIDTLGQFAALPAAAVRQRFGAGGLTVHGWAGGRDPRPVRADLPALPQPIDVDFESPMQDRDWICTRLLRAFRPQLRMAQQQLDGLRRLRASLRDLRGETHALALAFTEPLSDPDLLRTALLAGLERLHVETPLTGFVIEALDFAEAPPGQLSLFPTLEDTPDDPAALALRERLITRYAGALLQARAANPAHVMAERRYTWHAVGQMDNPSS